MSTNVAKTFARDAIARFVIKNGNLPKSIFYCNTYAGLGVGALGVIEAAESYGLVIVHIICVEFCEWRIGVQKTLLSSAAMRYVSQCNEYRNLLKARETFGQARYRAQLPRGAHAPRSRHHDCSRRARTMGSDGTRSRKLRQTIPYVTTLFPFKWSSQKLFSRRLHFTPSRRTTRHCTRSSLA